MNLYDLLRGCDDYDAIIIMFGEMYIYANKKFVYDYCKRELMIQNYTEFKSVDGVHVFVCDELNPNNPYNEYAC